MKTDFLTNRFCLSAGLLVALLLAPAVPAAKCEPRRARSADVPAVGEVVVQGHRVGGILLDTLDEAGLHVAWSTRVPMGRADQIKTLFYRNGRLYAVDAQNYLYAMAGDTGAFLWSVSLGQPEASCSLPSQYQDRLLFVVGNSVAEVRETDGSLTLPEKQLELDFPVSTTVVRNEDYLFAGGADRRFYCLKLPSGVAVWTSVCPGDPTGTIALHDKKVYFACSDHVVYVSQADARQLVWKRGTAGLMPGVVIADDKCYVPSEDTALYCFDAQTGVMPWPKVLTGGRLTELPALTGETIYQPRWQAGLLCINREDGSVRWDLADGSALLAEAAGRAYVKTLNEELVVLDHTNGKVLVSFLVGDLGMHAVNTEDQRIFLGSRAGVLVTLEPNE